ncbi:22281_t:CDS:2, partial [Racocetra persica]
IYGSETKLKYIINSGCSEDEERDIVLWRFADLIDSMNMSEVMVMMKIENKNIDEISVTLDFNASGICNELTCSLFYNIADIVERFQLALFLT